jgi:hypothetical protein
MTRRRSNDEGTVSQDRRTGLWVARLPAPWTPKPFGLHDEGRGDQVDP